MNLSDVANLSVILTCLSAYLAWGNILSKATIPNPSEWHERVLSLAILIFWPVFMIVEKFL